MSGRDHMPTTHDCNGDAAAYALGALEHGEADAFKRHLESCAVCRDELTALQEVVHALPMAAPQHPAPKRLRRQVLRAAGKKTTPARKVRLRRAPLRPPRTRAMVLAGACAAIELAVLAGLNLSSGSGVRVIPARVAGISGAAQIRLSDNRGELIVRNLSPPPPGDIYELWLKRPHRTPTPVNVLFSVTTTGAAEIGLPPKLGGIKEILVTPEPKGGSPRPTHRPVIVAPLT